MRTIEVDTGGYADASLCLRDGNEWACHYFGELLHGLAETGAMAGDSSFAEPFAEGYDEAARAAMDTYASVVRSFATLGRYAFASVENHTYAELASTLGGGLVVTHSPELSAEAWYEIGPAPVPSSLGGDPSSMPDWANWILDEVEGFVWPDADLDRLRRTGDLWREAADHLDEIAGRADFSVGLLAQIRSPEIPLAISSVNDLGTATRDLGAQCRVLGDACTGYADAVEEQREAVIDLVHDLLRDAIIIQSAGFLAGLVTFGAAAYGATAINVAKISHEASRFKVMIELLRAYAIEAKVAMGAGTAAMWETQRRLRRFVEARSVMLGERGSFQIIPGTPKAKTFLGLHEGGPLKAHTLKKHVGKTDEYLRHRLATEPSKKMVSTFPNEQVAEDSIKTVLAREQSKIQAWLATSTSTNLPLSATFTDSIGRVMMRSGDIVPGHVLQTRLVKDASMPDGYRILTTYVFP